MQASTSSPAAKCKEPVQLLSLGGVTACVQAVSQRPGPATPEPSPGRVVVPHKRPLTDNWANGRQRSVDARVRRSALANLRARIISTVIIIPIPTGMGPKATSEF